jgi:uncharacterized membrane protein YvlD (DUF360 family)
MKSIVRVLVFTFIALQSAQYVIKAFLYGGNDTLTFILVWFSLGLLYFLLKPILSIIGLPSKGLSYIFLLFVLTFAVLYVLTLFKDLTSLWAALFSAFVVGIVYSFLQGLCAKK